MEFLDRFALLTSITWNSNHWQAPLTDADIAHSSYAYVRENRHAVESLNFGHDLYPPEPDGTYIGYSPMLDRSVSEPYLAAVFFLSTDHHKQRQVVGVYAFPQLGQYHRTARHKLYRQYDTGNLRAHPHDIVYFPTPITLTNALAAEHQLLPEGKSISQQGFNYLTSHNTRNLLQLAARANPGHAKLAALLQRFSFEEKPHEEEVVPPAPPLPANPDTLAGLAQLEARMRHLTPEVRHRLSAVIERGRIASAVKRLTGYRCLICEALGQEPIGFRKPNGIPYIETHHVDPVANRAIGSLSVTNLITVCATHHRQLHFGRASLIKVTATTFHFRLDDTAITIPRLAL